MHKSWVIVSYYHNDVGVLWSHSLHFTFFLCLPQCIRGTFSEAWRRMRSIWLVILLQGKLFNVYHPVLPIFNEWVSDVYVDTFLGFHRKSFCSQRKRSFKRIFLRDTLRLFKRSLKNLSFKGNYYTENLVPDPLNQCHHPSIQLKPLKVD